MFKENSIHLQLVQISYVINLPEYQRKRLEQSWARTFYPEFFCWIDESVFEVLYSDMPSRSNVSGLE